jgi:U3 small nucleolar RNA-associated protein 18
MERFFISPSGAYMALIGSKGTLQVLDSTTTQWICSANIEGEIADVAWSSTSDSIIIANTAGEVYDYSLMTKSITSVWRDEGGVSTTRVSISPNNRWIVVGSGTGLVNIYDRRISFGGKAPGALGTPIDPKPIKTIENLVTSINVLEFSPDSQILCIASRAKKDALKMVHLPSCTVYKNWPTSNTPLGRVTTVAFAPGKEVGMVAVGNEQGRVRLFEIR